MKFNIYNLMYYNIYDDTSRGGIQSNINSLKNVRSLRVYYTDKNNSEKSINFEIKRFFFIYLMNELFPKISENFFKGDKSRFVEDKNLKESSKAFLLDFELNNKKDLQSFYKNFYIDFSNNLDVRNSLVDFKDNLLRVTIPIKSLSYLEEVSKNFIIDFNNHFLVFEFRFFKPNITKNDIKLIFPFFKLL